MECLPQGDRSVEVAAELHVLLTVGKSRPCSVLSSFLFPVSFYFCKTGAGHLWFFGFC
jgi:hypothetical protein